MLLAMGGSGIASVAHGLTHLIGSIPDQDHVHQLFELLRDLNIELVSINQVSKWHRRHKLLIVLRTQP